MGTHNVGIHSNSEEWIIVIDVGKPVLVHWKHVINEMKNKFVPVFVCEDPTTAPGKSENQKCVSAYSHTRSALGTPAATFTSLPEMVEYRLKRPGAFGRVRIETYEGRRRWLSYKFTMGTSLGFFRVNSLVRMSMNIICRCDAHI